MEDRGGLEHSLESIRLIEVAGTRGNRAWMDLGIGVEPRACFGGGSGRTLSDQVGHEVQQQSYRQLWIALAPGGRSETRKSSPRRELFGMHRVHA